MLKSFKEKGDDTTWKLRCIKKEYTALEMANAWVKTGFILLNFFPFVFISWRLITPQYCSGFCYTLT